MVAKANVVRHEVCVLQLDACITVKRGSTMIPEAIFNILDFQYTGCTQVFSIDDGPQANLVTIDQKKAYLSQLSYCIYNYCTVQFEFTVQLRSCAGSAAKADYSSLDSVSAQLYL